jgi:L-iditol 2-dehydrogenase
MVVKDVPTPTAGPGEVLVRVRACAVCGSDLRIYHHGNPRVVPPQVIGHEIAGDVADVGPGVQGLEVGDRVASGADVPCGVCPECRDGRGNNCAINYAIGYQFPGGFQQRMLLNETVVKYGPITPIPDSLPYEEAAIAEPLACSINGLELGGFRPGMSLAVIGLGPIGRLEMAHSFAPEARFIATEEEDPVQTVMKETAGEGVDFAITTAGTTQAQEWAIKMIRHRGVVNLFAGLKNQPPLTIDSNLIHYREAFIMGSHGSLPRHHRAAVDLIARGRVSARRYLSRTFPLAQIGEALAFHESRRGLKVIVAPQS